jgi:trehalose synthase-fused probable maltokinase
MNTPGNESQSPRLPLPDWIREPVLRTMPEFLGRQRWFADKHRAITSIELADSAFLRLDKGNLLLVIATILFADTHESTYFIPLLLRPNGERASEGLCSLTLSGETLDVVDALPEPEFHQWLLGAIRTSQVLESEHGRILCHLESESAIPEAGLAGRLAGVEQSNTSILFGDSLIAKVYRRLSPGINPDLEVGRYLSNVHDLDITPALIGSAQLEHPGSTSTLITIQQQIRRPVDCWTHVLGSLGREDWESAAIGGPLGSITARLHVALASGTATPDFVASITTSDHVVAWKAAIDTALDQVSQLLSAHQRTLDSATRDLVETFTAALPDLRWRSAGLDALLGLPLIRVHGDYHLGQVLRSPDGRLSIVDFEGEPQRPIQERRMKTSPLKDVAGMLRSFSYARGAVAVGKAEPERGRLAEWEAEQRRDFVSAYRRIVGAGGLRLVPDQPAALGTAIAAWEIDKALYEVMYELSSRPDWLWLPLTALVDFA